MKIVAFLISLLITLFYAAGYFIVFTFQQQYIKKEMKQLIRSGMFSAQYETFTFAPAQLELLKVEPHEFVYGGKMYDIVKTSSDGELVTVICIQDEREKELISQFSKYLSHSASSHQSPGQGNSTASLLHFLQTVFITPCSQLTVINEIAAQGSFYQLTIYQWPASTLFNPPPESVHS